MTGFLGCTAHFLTGSGGSVAGCETSTSKFNFGGNLDNARSGKGNMVTITLGPDNTKLAIRPSGYNVEVNEMMQHVIGKRWVKNLGCWLAPFSNESLQTIKALLSQVTEVKVDQRLDGIIEQQEKRASSVIELKSLETPLALPEDFTFTTEPFLHQKKAISFGITNRAFAYFMEMGTGKTKVILDLIGYYLPKTRELHRPALVICPVSVMHNWKKQAKIHRPEVNVVVLEGSTEEKELLLLRKADVYVINYESAWRIYDALCSIKWGFMVLDESTRIKNRSTKQAKAIIKLGGIASRRYILTGTPSPNSPLELFNQIKFLDPNIFGNNWYFYRDRYCLMGGFGGYQILGFRNLEELSKKISGISYRVLKSECLDLPDKIFKQYRLPMSEDQERAYKELAEDLVTTVGTTELRTEVVLAKLTKLRQIASGFAYLPDGTSYRFENEKVKKLKEILEENIDRHKFVIWASFQEEIQLLEDLMREMNIKFVKLGDAGTRHIRVQEFQEDPSVRVFISNQRSGGIGIDLFAADYCVFFSNDYSPEIRLQAEDRLHRIGQRNSVTYIDLISKASIDSTILRMLSNKQDLSNQIMSGKIRYKEIIHGDDDNTIGI